MTALGRVLGVSISLSQRPGSPVPLALLYQAEGNSRLLTLWQDPGQVLPAPDFPWCSYPRLGFQLGLLSLHQLHGTSSHTMWPFSWDRADEGLEWVGS